MKESLHTQKKSCLSTLVRGGVFILLCTSTLAKRQVQPAEGATQTTIQLSLSKNRSHTHTAPTNKSFYPRKPKVALPMADQLLFSFESIDTIARLGGEVKAFKMGTIIREVQISQTQTLESDNVSIMVPPSTEGSCCITNLSFAIVSTVVSEYTGTSYNVKHYSSSYQALTQGNCLSTGASCSLSGTCQVTNRIQWIIVDIGNGSDACVPVSVPSHCYCRLQ